jgi:MFS family permease
MDLRNRIGLYGAYLFGMSGIGFTLPFLPLYLSEKGLSDRQIGMLSTVAALTALAQFPIALWADRWQWRKPLLLAALALVAISTVLLPTAQSVVWLGVLVVLFAENGICRAVVDSLSGAEAASLAAADQIGAALGALRFFRPLGVVVVALVGGFWAERYGVDSILVWLAAVQCLAAAVAMLIHDKKRRCAESGDAPLPSAGASSGRDAALPLPRLWGQTLPEPPGAGETHAPPVRRNFDRGLWAFIAAMVLFHFCNAPAGVYLGLFLKRDLDAPDRFLSYAFVVSMIAWTLIARPAGRLADRIGRRPLLIAGWIVMSVRLVLIALAEEAWQVIAIQVLDGVASGLFSILAGAWLTDRLADPRRVSEAQAIVGTSLVFGSALGPLAAAHVVDLLGYRGLFGALAVVGGISTLTLMAFVPETLQSDPGLLGQAGGEVTPAALPTMPLLAAETAALDGERAS